MQHGRKIAYDQNRKTTVESTASVGEVLGFSGEIRKNTFIRVSEP